MLSVKNDFIDYLLSKGRIKYNLTLPYLDINVLLIDLPPYGNNKYVIYVDSFIGIFIYSFIDFDPLKNENIYEITEIKYDLISNLYYSKVSNIINDIITNYITKINISPLNIENKNFVCFIPFEVFADSDISSLDVLYKEIHDGIFISKNVTSTGSIVIDGTNLVNRFNRNVIDNNVEKIYGSIYYNKIAYKSTNAFYEAAVYKKFNSNDIYVYFKNSYLNISTIKNIGEFFDDTDFSNSNVFISFIPSNVIVYKNKGTGGFIVYRLLDYSINQIKLYLKNLYGFNYLDTIDKNKFYSSKFKPGYNKFKLSRSYSGQENIPDYVYCMNDVVVGIADKIFNFSYFDLTESSVVRTDIPELYLRYWNEHMAYSIYNNNFYRFNIQNNNIYEYKSFLYNEYIIENISNVDLTNIDVFIPTDLKLSDYTELFIVQDNSTVINTFYLDEESKLFIKIPYLSADGTSSLAIYKNELFNNNLNNDDFRISIGGLVAYYDFNIKNYDNAFINMATNEFVDAAAYINFDSSSVVFNGSNSYVKIPALPIKNIGDKFTIMSRFRINSISSPQILFMGSAQGTGYYTFGISLNDWGVNGSVGCHFGKYGSFERYVRSNANKITSGTQYNITATYSGGTTNSSLKLYLDSTEINDYRADSGSYSTPSDAASYWICSTGSSKYLNGNVDRLIIFNVDLSSETINLIFNNYNSLYPDKTNLFILNNYNNVILYEKSKILDYLNETDFTYVHILNVISNETVDNPIAIKIYLNTYDMISNGLISLDGTDLLFVDENGDILPYYVWDNQNTNNTEIYVKLNKLNKNNQNTIYLLSGSVNDYRNLFKPEMVFIKFDDFNTMDLTKWTFSGTTSISNGVIRLNSPSNSGSGSISTTNDKLVKLELVSKVVGNSNDMRFNVKVGSNYSFIYDDKASGSNKGLHNGTVFVDNQTYDHGNNTFNGIFRIKITDKYFILFDPIFKLKTFNYIQFPANEVNLLCQYYSYIDIDKLLVRQSLNFEPISKIVKYIKIK